MKDMLVFDVTDADTIADSDSVGAFVRAGTDGDLIASQTINAEEWLNVASVLHDDSGSPINDANPLAVSVKDGVNVEVDLDHTDDSVALGDGTNLLTSTTVGADIGLDVNLINSSIEVTQGTDPWVIGDGGNSITVDAVDLDIRALTQSDEVTAYQGTSPWVVSATDLDIRTLQHDLDGNGDSVRLGDGTSFITSTTVGADIGLDVNILNDIQVNDAALADTSILSTATTLTAAGTAEKVVSSNLSNRKYLFIYNKDNKKAYIGGSGVDKDNGFPISPGSYMELRAGASVDVYFDSEKTGAEIRVLEQS